MTEQEVDKICKKYAEKEKKALVAEYFLTPEEIDGCVAEAKEHKISLAEYVTHFYGADELMMRQKAYVRLVFKELCPGSNGFQVFYEYLMNSEMQYYNRIAITKYMAEWQVKPPSA